MSNAAQIDLESISTRDEYITAFADFIEASPTSFHAADTVARMLNRAGFEWLDECDSWAPLEAGAAGFTVRDGSLIAWQAGSSVTKNSPLRIFGAHTDSPGFVVKPTPGSSAAGWQQLNVEVYGGPLLNSWLDRDLAVAGRVFTRDGEKRLIRTPAIARIPQLAVHLDREANNGLKLDRQEHTQPVIGVGEVDALTAIATAAGVAPDELVSWDLQLADTQKPRRIGASNELFAAGRMDNLSSTFAGAYALASLAQAEHNAINLLVLFDHEEVGSQSHSGAKGTFLEDIIVRLYTGLGATAEDLLRVKANSWHVSADAGHAVHPNYSSKHDPHTRPFAGKGAMLKINANRRYATDGAGAAMWVRVCDGAGVPLQQFVANNSVPCGSTIGSIAAANNGIRTVDVGAPLLSMHSARELAHVDDLWGLALATAQFYRVPRL
ncbi:M18 family aminopeptidase [Canibacter zhoujuaniae]|uniref:M18 family aminopeptidase n=1 Tax=Canibacter zhoujuaniae TaxID=2708343 RepID=UPI0014233880|nr:M18 family aminopeptidase [Canibacter zhoujuaniae]